MLCDTVGAPACCLLQPACAGYACHRVAAAANPPLTVRHVAYQSVLHVCMPQVWDVKDAGLQAASRVAAAADPLALLAEISQNFPAIVSSLTRQQVREIGFEAYVCRV